MITGMIGKSPKEVTLMSEFIDKEKLIQRLSDVINTAPMTYAGGLALAIDIVRSAPVVNKKEEE